MNGKQIKRLRIFFSIFLIILSACNGLAGDESSGAIEGSGMIEAVEVVVAPELNGRIATVFVKQGDTVAAGDELFRLENDLLAIQRDQAIAALETAQANLAMAQAGREAAVAALDPAHLAIAAATGAVDSAHIGVAAAQANLESAQASVFGAEVAYEMALAAARFAAQPDRVGAWNESQPDEFETPSWYFQSTESLSAVAAEMGIAEAARVSAQSNHVALMADARFADVLTAENRLAQAQAAFLVATELRERQIAATEAEQIDTYVQDLYDTAVAELAAAQLSFDQLLTDQGAADVLEARARLAAAQERYEIARDQYFTLLSGEEALTVKAGQAGVQQTIAVALAAEANVALAEANVAQAELGVAQAEAYLAQLQANIKLAEEGVHQAEAMVAQAQKSLDLIDLQMQKLTVYAAVAGVVLNRNIEAGELIQPGAAAMTLAQLDDLTVTVYIPENRYGQLQLGDKAIVTVDSFPDKSFTAVVVRIADEAEFTPRNVQTQEERQTTVYAVELTVNDANMQLKPGMPADVRFDR